MKELELLKNRIKYRSSYRGTKEMDILLSSFAKAIVENLSLNELKFYYVLIAYYLMNLVHFCLLWWTHMCS